MWAQVNRPDRSWVVAVAGLLLNVMMWLADGRNRPAIGRAKDIGKAIEAVATNGIKEEWCFFSRLDGGGSSFFQQLESKVPHNWLIDLFGLLSSGMFIGAALALR
jgi:hypothetical protein